jgi:phage gp46-like protein
MNISIENGIAIYDPDATDDILTDVYCSTSLIQGSWFLDRSKGTKIGSLKKNTEQNRILAIEFVKETLQWMLTAGRISSVEVVSIVMSDFPNRLGLKLKVVKPNRDASVYEFFVKVV